MSIKTFTKPKAATLETNDSGFGAGASNQGQRLVTPEGRFNVKRRGMRLLDRLSFYHALITMPWYKFNLLVVGVYALINLVFATIYVNIGMDQFAGVLGHGAMAMFSEAFFFSAQTLTTVGYGRVNPVGLLAESVAALESLGGLLGFALITGLLYGRFARPVAMIIFSNNMLVSPYKPTGTGLMFRIANAKNNMLSDVSAQVLVSYIEDAAGEARRRYFTLPLERSQINYLSLSWTVVHPLTEDSPLYNLSQAEMEHADTEFIITIKGFDETSSQPVQRRSSYKYHHLVWDARFLPMYRRSPSGEATELDLDLISAYLKVNNEIVNGG